MNRMVRGRFAPTPGGRMHLGNLLCALLAWLSAKSQNGEMLLRIEDLDAARCSEAYANLIIEDLKWLGLNWSEEPPVYRQSRRTKIYESYFYKLMEQNVVYPCFCSRADRLAAQAPHLSDGRVIYDRRCLYLTPEERKVRQAERRPAWRLRVPDGETFSFQDGCQGMQAVRLDRDFGDFILRRADGVYSYQLAAAIDDGLTGVTEVVRGRDLLTSAACQRYICEMLSLPAPERYCHIPLLLNPDGKRLSKRDQDMDMGILRRRFTPEKLAGYLAFLCRLQDTPEPGTPEQFISSFSWDKIPREDIRLPAKFFSDSPGRVLPPPVMTSLY